MGWVCSMGRKMGLCVVLVRFARCQSYVMGVSTASMDKWTGELKRVLEHEPVRCGCCGDEMKKNLNIFIHDECQKDEQ